MKKLLLTAFFLVFAVGVSQAIIRTVSNWSFSPGQFTSPAAALALSNSGDTIYVHGSSLSYGNFTVNRPGVVIIGAGHNPAKTPPLPTIFASISVSAINCQFIGLTVNIIISNGGTTNTVVKRCKLQASGITNGIAASIGNLDSWLVEGNVFLGTSFDCINFSGVTTNNTIIRNNVFNGALAFNSSSTTPFTFVISNNLFLGTLNAFATVSQALINNNIFFRSSPQGTGTGCTMNNNISYQTANNNFPSPGINNLVNVNPMFTTFPALGAFFDYAHDYHLAAGSPGLLTGDDGTDRGVYGGFGAKFNMGGEPAIAEITSVTITSPSVIAPGGSLTISVTAKRVN